MVILSSTSTRLMNFQSELLLRTNESQISFEYVLISLRPKKIPFPSHQDSQLLCTHAIKKDWVIRCA